MLLLLLLLPVMGERPGPGHLRVWMMMLASAATTSFSAV
jgi:hypothetical protein